MMVSSKVPANYNGRALIDYLTKRFTYFSMDEWIKRCNEGKIHLNNRIERTPDTIVNCNDTVAYEMPPFAEPPADLNYRVIFEDEWLLAVDKPGNLLVHKSGKSFTTNLVYQLRYCHRPAPHPRIGAVNRLDRETSGIVLFAKDAHSLRLMNEALARRAVRKEYCAVVKGLPEKKSWLMQFPIGKSTSSSISYKYCVDLVGGKEAQTRCELVRRLGSGHALLCVEPVTGRTHQIRVHLAAIGLPIVGDLLYGGGEEDFLAWRGDPASGNYRRAFHRHALHCQRVIFKHPIAKGMLTLEAPLPSDMQDLIKDLENTI